MEKGKLDQNLDKIEGINEEKFNVIERLDDRYVTYSQLNIYIGAFITLIIGFVIFTFTSISNLNTKIELQQQKIEQLSQENEKYSSHLSQIDQNTSNIEKNTEYIRKKLDK